MTNNGTAEKPGDTKGPLSYGIMALLIVHLLLINSLLLIMQVEKYREVTKYTEAYSANESDLHLAATASAFAALVLAVSVLLWAFGFYCGLSLYNRTANATRFVKGYIVLSLSHKAAGLAWPFLSCTTLGSSESMSIEAQFVFALSVVWWLIWYAYLSRSSTASSTTGDQQSRRAKSIRRLNDALVSAVRKANWDAACRLLGDGASPSASFGDGPSVLMFAAMKGERPMVQLLLEKGADPNYQDVDGLTALMYAVSVGDAKAADTMRRSGIDYPTPFTWISKCLLEHGADPDLRDKSGMTALMPASVSGKLDHVKLLLEFGSDPNVQEQKGCTALMGAAIHGHGEVVRYLLSHGAKMEIRNCDALTASDLAKSAGHSHVAKQFD
ncbi:MAG: hypothetical protein GC168_10120 [Candidatus Hydrogenedens sp.]|nr:hypothetical protein [Candidatus Hydrogenedens sp.]